ncbi:hypothetical protein EDD22DRAFT_892236, partial [Suillus occidentalis]
SSTFICFLLFWRRHSKQLPIEVLLAHMDFKCSHTLQVVLPYSRRWDISFRLFLSHNKYMINQNSMPFPTSPLPLVRHDKFTCIRHQSGFISIKIQDFTAEGSSCHYLPSTDDVLLAGLLAVPISPLETRIIILFGLIDPLHLFLILGP